MSLNSNPKRLNGDAKILFDHLNKQREDDRVEDKTWKTEHNDSAREFRSEIKEDISEVWKAMREGFEKLTDAIINQPRIIGTEIKTVIGISMFLLTIITFIGVSLGTSLVTLKTEVIVNNKEIEKRFLERHLEQGQVIRDVSIIRAEQIKALDLMLQRDIRAVRGTASVDSSANKVEILRIREWKDRVENTQGATDAKQSTEIENIKALLKIEK